VTDLDRAKAVAFAVPAALLAGAYGSQYFGHLFPCEMCWWQRDYHFTALAAAVLAYVLRTFPDRGRSLVWLAALAILVSGGIGFYHAGVEMKVFTGFTRCTATAQGTADEMFRQIMDAPIVRCDQVQWSLLGISMAGWNFLVSTGSAVLILWLSLKKPRSLAPA
jgi:disulfide bond formation protein DsbB